MMPVKPVTTDWRLWAAWGRRWMGVATTEASKRAAVAECLDAYRKEGIIR